VVDDYVNFIDLAPTWLAVAGITPQQSGMQPLSGRSLLPLLTSNKSGQIDPARDHILIGKERHDIGRPNDGGYPFRGIVKGGYLYLRNFEPTRWPAGNPETGYLNCDGGPTKTLMINQRRSGETQRYWNFNFGKRPAEEFYHTAKDPDCMKNLVGDATHAKRIAAMKNQMLEELKAQNDRRILGDSDYYEAMPYAHSKQRGYYEKYRQGKVGKGGWVTPSDYEPKPLD